MPRVVPLIPLTLAILYAPLMYGCTTSAAIWGLDALLLLTVGCWLLQKLEQREGFHIRPAPAVLVLLLGLMAVTQVLNPHAVLDPATWDLRHLKGGLPVLPRTMDRATSLALLPHLLVLGISFLAIMDLAYERKTRWLMLRMVAISGVLVALIGLVQKAAGGDPLLWGHLHPSQTTYFATFRYHGNAASFLNLCWPAALALFLRSCHERNYLGRSLWGLAWLFVYGALFVNTSKFGQALALPLLLVAGMVCFRHFPGEWFFPNWRNILVLLVVVAVLVVLTLPTLGMTWSFWQRHLDEGMTLQLRRMTYGVCLEMIREAPLFGFGAGSFRILFPYYSVSLGDLVTGRWTHAHQDYLQAIIEWGWIGAAMWASLLLTPVIGQLVRSLGPRADLTGSAAVIAVVATLIHGAVDFPFQIASIQFYCLLYLAFLWRARHQPELKSGERPAKPDRSQAPCRS